MVDTISDVPEITGGQTFDSVSVANVFGQQGKQGIKGEKGKTGAVYFPVLKDGVLSWVNNGGLPNPEPVDVKTIIAVGAQGIPGQRGADGKRGEKGAPGVRGLRGENGAIGKDGKDGANGADGKDGATFKPSYDDQSGVLSWTNDGGLPNPPPIVIKGKDGKDGKDGKNGKNGLGGANGKKGEKGEPGTTDYNNLDNKPDLSIYQPKEEGKGLSTNDYTNEDKERLADTSGENTGDQDLSNLVVKETGKGLSTNDYTNEDKERLADTSGENTGDQDLRGLLPKSGGAMTGVLAYTSPQVLNMQPVDTEPDVGDMVEGCIYFVAEDV